MPGSCDAAAAAAAAGKAILSAVMVRVHGPDPKGRKMRQHAFYSAESGDTALSASGVLFFQSNRSAVVITCASIVEPFLSSRPQEQRKVQLLPGAELEVFMEAPEDDGSTEPRSKPSWVPAQLLKLVNVSRASEALKDLLNVQGVTTEGSWEIGWTLAQVNGNQLGAELVAENKTEDAGVRWRGNSKEIALEGLVTTSASIAAASTRVAVFSLETTKINRNYELTLSNPCKRGDMIRTVGSPFGVLSPLHFFNSISVGIVSNCWPSSSSLILMADIRCLPGMEGGPAFDSAGNFVGILLRPLRQRSSSAEVQLILTARVLLTALQEAGIEVICNDLALPDQEQRKLKQEAASDINLQHAVPSVVLVTVNDGTWASGIVLNKTGLILTNAHLLEPWRFGKQKPDASTTSSSLGAELLETLTCTDSVNNSSRMHIRVRLDHSATSSWHSARAIFVSQGPLDVALLQLTSLLPSSDLHPLLVEESEPVPGSPAFVIGHGLFGPRSELEPSVTAGVVSRVVEAGQTVPPLKEYDSVMLQTTAAVHPGGSGGAVVNGEGRMIGLVTSNTKHNKQTTIPYLNFSIPCAALRPVFEFASRGHQNFSLLRDLEKPNELLSTVWAVVPPNHLEMSRLLLPWQDQRDGVKKGSQFAKFIADRQAELMQQQDGSMKDKTKPAFSLRSCL